WATIAGERESMARDCQERRWVSRRAAERRPAPPGTARERPATGSGYNSAHARLPRAARRPPQRRRGPAARSRSGAAAVALRSRAARGGTVHRVLRGARGDVPDEHLGRLAAPAGGQGDLVARPRAAGASVDVAALRHARRAAVVGVPRS